jgi:hypothetical protein
MKNNLTWTKGLFTNLYQIYSDGNRIGVIKERTFSQSAKASINGKEYLFRTRGFFNPYTEIIDCLSNQVIGKIEFNNWRSKATVFVNGRKIHWKHDNLWNTQWSLSDSGGIVMKFSSSTTKGQIDAQLDDGLLVLAGLFIKNYYLQTAFFVIFVAVIIPVLA